MKKIVIFITELGNGGSERIAANLANSFAENANTDVYVILLYNKEHAYKMNENIKMNTLPFHTNHLLRIIHRMISVHKILKKIQPDVVFAIPQGTVPYVALDTYINNSYFVVFSQRADPGSEYPAIWKRKMANFIFRRADKVVFQTREQMEFFDADIQNKGMVIINPLMKSLPERDFNSIDKCIVTFCRLVKEKNIALLIDAFSELLASHPDYILRIWGKGEQETFLREKVDKMNLNEAVFFEGYSENVHDNIKNACIYVNSSDHEGMSNAILESMAIGLPVICTDCPSGGSRMIIKDHVNGLLIPVADKNALVSAMRELIENDELRNTISRNAMLIKEELAGEKVYKKWKQLADLKKRRADT